MKHVSAIANGGHAFAPSARAPPVSDAQSIARALKRWPAAHVTEHSVHGFHSRTRQSPDLQYGAGSSMYVGEHAVHVRLM
jgi:hypothetical protein